jgi:choline dehydrogenase
MCKANSMGHSVMDASEAITADYVIVGAGTAGCVLADRLSDDGSAQVALLEAGGDDRRLRIRMPIGYGMSFYDPGINWMYRAQPDAALNGREGYWPRGRVVGGSGSINAMVHVRGLPSDYDDWAAAGNPGWAWRDVAPYFDRALARVPGNDVSAEVHALCRNFIAAGEALGFAHRAELNAGDGEGVGTYPIATRGGFRLSSARAYLAHARSRPNFRLIKHALATRILFDGRRAVGAEYRTGGHTRVIRARREVILATGSIKTPKLLQLSGIGPAELLRRHGITPLLDSPAVGRHMQDHLCIDHLYRARVPTLNQVFGTWSGKIAAALRYALTRGGPLSLSVNQAGGFVRSREGLARPDMQLYFSPLSYTRIPAGTRPLMRPDPFPGFLLSAQPCRPTSRGHIEIASPDADVAPAIHPNSLASEADIEALLDGSALLRRLAAAPGLHEVIDAELAPGRHVEGRDAMLADIRARASTVFHPVSTARMAPDIATGVVDARLRAYGLERLRIADASVFPYVTSGNTNLPTIMLAEKAADLILDREPPASAEGV